MSDPITTAATILTEHPQAVAAVASVYGVVKPFLAKILGPGADEIGEIGRDYIKGRRAKNVERTLADADKLLAETGREPQEVPLNIAVPLLEAASLQEEPSIAEKWAALLANAADPAQRVVVQPSFVSILKDVTVYDAVILQMLVQIAQESAYKDLTSKFIKLEVLQAAVNLSIAEADFLVSIDNLARLQLCVAVGTRALVNGTPSAGFHPMLNPVGPGKEQVALTHMGLAFLAAVTPPTP